MYYNIRMNNLQIIIFIIFNFLKISKNAMMKLFIQYMFYFIFLLLTSAHISNDQYLTA